MSIPQTVVKYFTKIYMYIIDKFMALFQNFKILKKVLAIFSGY